MDMKSYCMRCLEDIGLCACRWNDIAKDGLGFKTLSIYQIRLLRKQKKHYQEMDKRTQNPQI